MDPQAIALRFNDCITARDVDGLATLMTDDHQFVDTEQQVVSGKDACIEAWRGFLEQFPDYRNVFSGVIPRDEVVVLIGYSECSFEPLAGPAIWTATIRGKQLAQWRVYHDTEATRKELRIA